MNEQQSGAIDEWCRLMNAGEYFEAHEVLEPAWMVAVEPEKTFLKGLIHAAVALCHYQRGNGHGARVKFASAVRYLSPYPECYLGVRSGALVCRMQEFFAKLCASPEGTPPPPPGPWPRVEQSPRAEG